MASKVPKNRDYHLQRRARQRKDPEFNAMMSERIKAWRRANPVRQMLIRARKRAKEHGIPFTITTANVVIPTHCPALGILFGISYDKDFGPSLDRINNSKGYVPGNVIVVSLRANRCKSNLTIEELGRVADFYRSLPDDTQKALDQIEDEE